LSRIKKTCFLIHRESRYGRGIAAYQPILFRFAQRASTARLALARRSSRVMLRAAVSPPARPQASMKRWRILDFDGINCHLGKAWACHLPLLIVLLRAFVGLLYILILTG